MHIRMLFHSSILFKVQAQLLEPILLSLKTTYLADTLVGVPSFYVLPQKTRLKIIPYS